MRFLTHRVVIACDEVNFQPALRHSAPIKAPVDEAAMARTFSCEQNKPTRKGLGLLGNIPSKPVLIADSASSASAWLPRQVLHACPTALAGKRIT